MTLRRRCASPAEARRLAAAVEADHPDGLVWRVRGPAIEFEFSAVSAESARATGDDLLACLSAAERTGAVLSGGRTDVHRRSTAR